MHRAVIDIAFTGAVLAGGASRRMGRDKALLTMGGEPAWLRQVRRLRDAGASRVGVVRQTTQPPLDVGADVAVWLDPVDDAGPLAGVVAAFSQCETPLLAVVATDMPHLDAAWWVALLGRCALERGVVSRHPDGTYEPLAAVYPRASLPEAERRLRAGAHSLQAWVEALVARGLVQSVELKADDGPRVASWNTPSDLNR